MTVFHCRPHLSQPLNCSTDYWRPFVVDGGFVAVGAAAVVAVVIVVAAVAFVAADDVGR